jgi:hypothetical protein
VQDNAKANFAIFLSYILMLVGIPAAIAQNSDGTTVTTEVQTIDPLDKYRGATQLTDLELKDLLSKVGFEGKSLRMAWAVAKKESNGHPLSHNTKTSTGDNSYGLFQINMIGSMGADRLEKFKEKIGISSAKDLLDPVNNAKAAFYMSSHGTDWGSWGLGPDAYDGTSDEPDVTKWLSAFPQN